MVGFYALAAGLVVGLLYIPYAEVRYLRRIDMFIAVPCLVGALAILAGVWPRRDVFIEPGPRLDAATQPRLFAAIGDVASRLGQELPSEVYLAPDVNAGVGTRGGRLGAGGRQIMVLGLPLLQALTPLQFRAALAHEFGHEHGGDLRLASRVWRTRAAIVETIQSLAGQGSHLAHVFVLYGKIFLRVTHSVSRYQEFSADAYAARACGADALAGALRATERASSSYDAYLQGCVAPVLESGFRPPLAEGFGRFLGFARGEPPDEERLPGPYDTHPPLKARLEAIGVGTVGEVLAPDSSAALLLDGLPELERKLLFKMVTGVRVKGLEPITWEEVHSRVLVPRWQSFHSEQVKDFPACTARDLPSLARDLVALGRRLTGRPLFASAASASAVYALGSALALALARQGWVPEGEPGSPTKLRLESEAIEPFQTVGWLADGRLAPEAWLQRCETLGILDLPLSARGVACDPGT